MKKKIASIVLFTCLIFTGCAQKATLLVPYDASKTSLVNTADNTDAATDESTMLAEQTGLKLYAADLCVVSKGKDSDRSDQFHSKAQFLVDLSNQEAIYASNIYRKLYPASITKIVTAYVALKYGNLKDTVVISSNAANLTEPGAKKCGFQEGDQISLEALLNSFLVYSGNDAGIAIAEHIAGSERAFAKMMNKEAKLLGAIDSHFVNPHGLHDKKHYTTCYDIYLFFQELIKNPEFNKIVSQSSYTAEFEDVYGTAKSLTFSTTNRYYLGLAAIPEGFEILGGKTGTTDEAGSCFIVHTKKGAKEYLSFIFKASDADSCFAEMTSLLEQAK